MSNIIITNTLCTHLSSFPSVTVDNKTIKINIFDMGGQPFFYEVKINKKQKIEIYPPKLHVHKLKGS